MMRRCCAAVSALVLFACVDRRTIGYLAQDAATDGDTREEPNPMLPGGPGDAATPVDEGPVPMDADGDDMDDDDDESEEGCGADPACVPCVEGSECPAALPYCDDGRCGECDDDALCGESLQCEGGRCVQDVDD